MAGPPSIMLQDWTRERLCNTSYTTVSSHTPYVAIPCIMFSAVPPEALDMVEDERLVL